jgi:hypothetical protein
MTMLTQARGPFRPSTRTREAVDATAAKTCLAAIKRFCMGALTVLLAGGIVAAIMALKVALYLPGFIHR